LGLAYMDKKDFIKALRLLTVYREKYSSSLSPDEKNKLETLINTCKSKSGKERKE
jgi:hypothetical protein